MFQQAPSLPRVQDLIVKRLGEFQPGSLVYLPAAPRSSAEAEEEDPEGLPMEAAAAICCTAELNRTEYAAVYLLGDALEGPAARFLHAGAYPELFARPLAGLERVPIIGFGPGRGMRIPKAAERMPGRGSIGFTAEGPRVLTEAPGGVTGMLDPIRWHIVTSNIQWLELAAEARLFEAKWATEEGAVVRFRIQGR